MRKAAKKNAKNGVKQRLAEISGAGGGSDALKFKIDASGGSDYNQRRQKNRSRFKMLARHLKLQTLKP